MIYDFDVEIIAQFEGILFHQSLERLFSLALHFCLERCEVYESTIATVVEACYHSVVRRFGCIDECSVGRVKICDMLIIRTLEDVTMSLIARMVLVLFSAIS